MKNVIKELEKTIDKINGSLLCIGLNNEYLIKKIKDNTNIIYCDLLNANVESGLKLGKKRKKHEKSISIKDFRKHYKKKKINYVISNISDINPYLPRFIPDSIYITNSVIYIYGNINFDYEKVIKKYRRYTNKIETIVANDMFFIKVDVGNARNSFFKDKIYFIIDNLEVFADKIGDILVG